MTNFTTTQQVYSQFWWTKISTAVQFDIGSMCKFGISSNPIQVQNYSTTDLPINLHVKYSKGNLNISCLKQK